MGLPVAHADHPRRLRVDERSEEHAGGTVPPHGRGDVRSVAVTGQQVDAIRLRTNAMGGLTLRRRRAVPGNAYTLLLPADAAPPPPESTRP